MQVTDDPFASGPIPFVGDKEPLPEVEAPTDDGSAMFPDGAWDHDAPQRRPERRPAPFSAAEPAAGQEPQRRPEPRPQRELDREDAPAAKATAKDSAKRAPQKAHGRAKSKPSVRQPARRPGGRGKPMGLTPTPDNESGHSPSGLGGLAAKLRGGSKADKATNQVTHLVPVIGRNLGGPAVITVIGKGGKTMTAAGIGHAFASERDGKVIVVDMCTEGGDLGDLVVRESSATVDDLLRNIDTVTSYRHVREFTSIAPSGLEFLVTDPNVADVPDITADDLACILTVLRQHYDLIILDTDAGIRDKVHAEALLQADHLVMVSAGAAGMRRGSWMINQLSSQRGHYEGKYVPLVDGMTVVVNDLFPNSSVDSPAVASYFADRVRETIISPFDAAVEGGAPIDPAAVSADLRAAWIRAAAAIATTVGAERNAR